MEELLDTNGLPWRPKGVGWVWDGMFAPSNTEREKLKYNMVSIFSLSHLIDTSGFRINTCSGSMEYN